MKPAEVVLGLDIGTTTICGVALAASGEMVASVERPNDSAMGGLRAGRAEQNPERIREQAFDVLRQLAARRRGHSLRRLDRPDARHALRGRCRACGKQPDHLAGRALPRTGRRRAELA